MAEQPGGPEGGGGGEGGELVECVVEFDYIAELNDELTLRVGYFLKWNSYIQNLVYGHLSFECFVNYRPGADDR